MSSMNEWVAIGITFASSIFTGGVMYGIFQTKLNELDLRLEKAVIESKDDRRDLRAEQKSFVTMAHFEAVIHPMRQSLESVQQDVKEILRAVKN
jgi:hypothetical protein